MIARSAVALLAVSAALALPAAAVAAPDADALLAQGGGGSSLRQTAPTDLTTAQGGRESGALSDTPPDVDGAAAGAGSAAPSPARAEALPFTGADARITLLLGVAALLLGAGLRLRTGDARDY